MIFRGKLKLSNLKMQKRQKSTVKDIIMRKIIFFQKLDRLYKFHQVTNFGLIWLPILYKKVFFKNALSPQILFIIINP